MHLPSHNPTCYKYNTHNLRVYRFDFLQLTLAESEIDLKSTIRLKRDNVWVNPWNPAIASII